MSDFTAGFASRLDAAARALALTIADTDPDFAPRDLKARASGGRGGAAAGGESGPVSFSPQPIGPRNSTGGEAEPMTGWDLRDGAGAAAAPANDPIATARASGYTEGFRDGHEQGDMERARDQALLRTLGEALQSNERVDRDLIATRLRQTVLFLVAKIIGDTGVAPDLLARRIDAATDLIAEGAEAATLRINPEDMPLLAELLPASLRPIADTAVQRGSFVLESAATIVEDGPDLWLEQLAQAIEQVGVPPLC